MNASGIEPKANIIVNELKFNKTKKFSFGSSSEKNGTKVNKGLLYWKDSFKSLRSSQNFYIIKTINYKNLSKKIK